MRVNVLRNRNCPTFASSVVDISIDQSSVSRVIYDANATDPDAAVSQVAIKIMKNVIATIFQNERKKIQNHVILLSCRILHSVQSDTLSLEMKMPKFSLELMTKLAKFSQMGPHCSQIREPFTR